MVDEGDHVHDLDRVRRRANAHEHTDVPCHVRTRGLAFRVGGSGDVQKRETVIFNQTNRGGIELA